MSKGIFKMKKSTLKIIFLVLFLATAMNVEAQFINLSYGLDAFWETNESTGTKSVDKHGNNNNLTLSNSAMWWNVSSPVHNIGMNLSPTSYYAYSQNSVNFGLDNYTIGGWFKRTQGGNSNILISSYGGSGSFFFIIYRDDCAGLCFQTGGGPTLFNVNKTMNLNEWYHIVMTKNGTSATNSTMVWVNGKPAHAITYSPGSYSDSIFFSDNGYEGGQQSQGFYYNRALSQQEVQLLYNNGLGRTYQQTIDGTFQIIANNESSGSGINNYNVSISLSNGTNLNISSNGNSLILTNISTGLTANLTFTTNQFFTKTYTNWNTSINLIANLTSYPTFVVTAKDGYNNSNISTFNVTINGTTYSTNNGTIRITIPINELVNISANSNTYHTAYINNQNLTQNLEILFTQIFLNITAVNALTGTSITNFNIITQYKNYTTTTGSVLANLTNGTAHNITITSSDYVSAITQVSYSVSPSNQSLVFYLEPNFNVRVFKESTGGKFNVNETNSTTVTFYCPTDVISREFNKSANDNTLSVGVGCPWLFVKLDVVYSSSSYFRTLIPSYSTNPIDFYAIDLNNEQAVQIILRLKDLTGEFENGTVRLERFVNGSDVEIIEQEFDMENKAVLYLIKDQLYTLSVFNDFGVERVTGYFLADSAGERTLTVPQIPFVPSSEIGDSIVWDWSDNATPVRLQYNDSEGETLNITFLVKNGSNTSQIIYSATSFNITSVIFSYSGVVNASYVACWSGYHEVLGFLTGECRVFGDEDELGFWTGWTDEERDTFQNRVSILLLVVLLLGLGALNIALSLTVVTVVMSMLMYWKWLSFGNVYIDAAIVSMAAVLSIGGLFVEGARPR